MKQKWKSSLSLSQRLYLPLVTFVVMLFLAFQTLSSYQYIENEKQNLVNRITILATGIGANLTAAIQFDDPLTGQEILSAFSADPMVNIVSIRTKNNALFAQYQCSDEEHMLPNTLEQEIIAKQGFLFSEHHLYMIVPVMFNGTKLAELEITVSLEALHAQEAAQFRLSLYILAALILVSSVSIYLLRQWMISPIRQLNKAMNNVIHHEYSREIVHPNPYAKDEISTLIDCFNVMIGKLNQRESKIKLTISQLETEKAFADDVISTVQHALLVVDHSGRIILANESSTSMFGQTAEKLRGQFIERVIEANDPDAFSMKLSLVLAGNDDFNHEQIKVKSVRGSVIYQVLSHPLPHKNQVLFALEDVTEKTQSERRQRMAAKIFENSREAILLLDSKGHIEMVNSAFCRLIGQTPDNVMGKYYREVMTETDNLPVKKDIQLSLSLYQQWQGECSIFNRQQNISIPLYLKINQIIDKDSNDSQIVVLASDLSSVKEAQRLAHIAQHDALTHLPNREFLHQYLREKLSSLRTNTMAVLFIDLDGFKYVNDTYGHEVGDQVLQIVAKKLLMCVRQSDVVTRLAGDEFVAVLSPVNSRDGIMNIGSRIIKNISQPINIKGNTVNVGASIGCFYIEPKDQIGIDNVLHCADMAMYQSKMKGKGNMTEFNQIEHQEVS